MVIRAARLYQNNRISRFSLSRFAKTQPAVGPITMKSASAIMLSCVALAAKLILS